MVYINKKITDGFSKYKYSCIDTSPLAKYVMHPFWDSVVGFLPLWLAPNLMTFIGFIMLVINFMVLTYYDYDFTASAIEITARPAIPNWVWLFCGIFNFLSHTLDGCDGKQARRTGTSSPVGELFDHGCDSWATMFFTLCIYSIFGSGKYGASTIEVYYMMWLIMGMFILSHFEKYNTGILFLPWGYDISQLTMSGMYIATYMLGASFWQREAVGGFTFGNLCVLLVQFGFWFLSLPHSLSNLYHTWKTGTGRKDSFSEAFRPLFSPLLLFFAATYWVHFGHNRMILLQPRIFYLAVGTACSNIACRLIVAQMSQTRCELINTMLFAYVPLAVLASCTTVLSVGMEFNLLVCFTFGAVFMHCHYAVFVVNEMLDYFKLRAFVITPKAVESKR